MKRNDTIKYLGAGAAVALFLGLLLWLIRSQRRRQEMISTHNHFSLAVVLILASASSLFGKDAPRKNPVPAESAQAEASKLFKEVYGHEYSTAKTAAEKQALAKKLLSKANESKDDPASQFVLLRLARDIATQAADGQTAFLAIDETAAAFQIDANEIKLAVLTKFAFAAQMPIQHESIAEEALKLVDKAIFQDNFKVADGLGKLAHAEARKTREKELVNQAQGRIAEVAELVEAYKVVMAAKNTLEKTPDDPEANLVVGKYDCFVKGDWDTGLPMLALGKDEMLNALAKQELEGVVSATEQAKLGDAWWNMAEKQEATAKKQMQARARYWYQKALPAFAGLIKDKLEKRVAETQFAPEAASGTARAKERKPGRAGRIFISCDDAFELYVNGEQVLAGKLNTVATRDYRFSARDVITVKCINYVGVKGFACTILFQGGSRITTTRGWMGYRPKSNEEWFKPQNVGELYAVVPGSNHDTTKQVMQACGVSTPDVWGQGETCYLVYVVKF